MFKFCSFRSFIEKLKFTKTCLNFTLALFCGKMELTNKQTKTSLNPLINTVIQIPEYIEHESANSLVQVMAFLGRAAVIKTGLHKTVYNIYEENIHEKTFRTQQWNR